MKNVGYVVGFVILIVIKVAVVGVGTNIEAELQKVSKELNKNCPQMIDEVTRMDKTSAGPGKLLTYFYTVLGAEDIEYTEDDFANVERSVRMNLEQSPDTDVFRQHHINLRYIYKDESGNILHQFTINY